jgi:hypothetical protein
MSTVSGTATNYLDLLDKLDTFLTATGHAWAKSFTGTGNGDLINYIGKTGTVAQTLTITATSSTSFTVVGSISGSLGTATAGVNFTSAQADFRINAGTTAFVAGDKFTLTLSPKWTRQRADGSPDQSHRTTNLADVANLLDGNTATYAYRAATTGYVDFEMHVATEVREFILGIESTSYAPKSWRIQWKNNSGDAWTTAQTWTNQTWSSSNEQRQITLTAAPGAHRYWRFEVTDTILTELRMSTLLFRAKSLDTYSVNDHMEYVWKAPGLDGTKSIYIGLQSYGSTDADTWNLGFCGFRSFNTGAGVDVQTNNSGMRWMSLIKSPISYWFVANGQRVIIVAKFSGIYAMAYLGFGLPYETPTVHEFPCIIAAGHDDKTLRYDSQSADYRYPPDPGDGSMAAFYPDAQWRLHANRQVSSSPGAEGQAATTIGGKVWPNALVGDGDQTPFQIRENIDGTHPLLPTILYHHLSPIHTWGEMDGVYWTPGFSTVSEALIREQGFNHMVVNNLFRTGTQHYAAIRLD